MSLRIIGLSGYAGAGKDTVADLLVREHGYRKFAFADRLKELLLEIDPIIDAPGFEDTRGVPLDWSCRRVSDLVEDLGWDDAKRKFPEVRRLLQVTGEAVKSLINPYVWVGQVLEQLPNSGRVVISDVRFLHEAKALSDRVHMLRGQFKVVRVHRDGVGPVNDHVSEYFSPGTEDHLLDLSATDLSDMPLKVRELAELVETW
ncbi:hypothetical protein [Nonomuraea sp. SYSU D8015]|uniref:hypothetical protein n=1 Tax=Nonomuraea sp. SYSU D8015 TaxID=2593644 RepID=UPI00166089CB|nr:hypothetical protein [Nonomuraea sp. SYSU D8015]